mmetsp:Transcript_54731/g.168620  ORF Transcript_54731/g.168620 Transcript_54731/m.168620 type:complete len:528 (-) Transcript_54731:191-1774(-)
MQQATPVNGESGGGSPADSPPDVTVRIQRGAAASTSHGAFGSPAQPAPKERRVRIVHVSDTHDKTYDLPAGDILVHSGDMTDGASPDEVERFRDFLRITPHRHKVLVCGSHETGMDRIKPAEVASRLTGGVPGCHVLHDAEVVLEGIKFYGTPWNNSAKAFAMSPEACEIKFQRIPSDADVLVTHQPPFGILDLAYPPGQFHPPDEAVRCADCGGAGHPGGKHWGSLPLRRRVEALGIPLHAFGRSHHSAGVQTVGRTVFSNGAMEVKGRAAVIDVIVEESSAAPAPAPAGQHTQPQPLLPPEMAVAPTPAATAAAVQQQLQQQMQAQVLHHQLQQQQQQLHQQQQHQAFAQPAQLPAVIPTHQQPTPPGSNPASFPPTPHASSVSSHPQPPAPWEQQHHQQQLQQQLQAAQQQQQQAAQVAAHQAAAHQAAVAHHMVQQHQQQQQQAWQHYHVHAQHQQQQHQQQHAQAPVYAYQQQAAQHAAYTQQQHGYQAYAQQGHQGYAQHPSGYGAQQAYGAHHHHHGGWQ